MSPCPPRSVLTEPQGPTVWVATGCCNLVVSIGSTTAVVHLEDGRDDPQTYLGGLRHDLRLHAVLYTEVRVIFLRCV